MKPTNQSGNLIELLTNTTTMSCEQVFYDYDCLG